jgi:hypothetical protein
VIPSVITVTWAVLATIVAAAAYWATNNDAWIRNYLALTILWGVFLPLVIALPTILREQSTTQTRV